jgi:lipoprotein-releasing system permease protein
LNIGFFLSKKLIPHDSQQISESIVNVSVISVALGVIILILAFAITTGFKNEIKEKMVGFGSHIEISHFDNNQSYENTPIDKKLDVYQKIAQLNHVINVQPFAIKAGIIKGDEDIEGVVFKGIEKSYPSPFFEKHLQKGHFILFDDSAASNEILVSEILANKLFLDTGQRLLTYFVQNPVRQRMFTIAGIYNTGLGKFDKNIILCDITHIQKLNDWQANQVSGMEVLIDDFENLDIVNQQINDMLPPDLLSSTIEERHHDIFDWIKMFNQNVYILIVLIIIVTSVSLISTQLTISLEHIPTIGILKTLGCTNAVIRNVFLYVSGKILAIGLLFGNTIALLLCFIQSKYHIITLNPDSYYVSFVPIEVDFWQVLLINLGVIAISIGILVIPSFFVAKNTKTIDALEMD